MRLDPALVAGDTNDMTEPFWKTKTLHIVSNFTRCSASNQNIENEMFSEKNLNFLTRKNSFEKQILFSTITLGVSSSLDS